MFWKLVKEGGKVLLRDGRLGERDAVDVETENAGKGEG